MSQYSDGDDNASVWHAKRPRARKEHTCQACGQTIPVGVVYETLFVLGDGGSETHKRCIPCVAMFDHLNIRMSVQGEEGEFPDVRLNCGHTYKKRWKEDPPPMIAALAFALPGDPVDEKALEKFNWTTYYGKEPPYTP